MDIGKSINGVKRKSYGRQYFMADLGEQNAV